MRASGRYQAIPDDAAKEPRSLGDDSHSLKLVKTVFLALAFFVMVSVRPETNLSMRTKSRLFTWLVLLPNRA